MKQMKKCKTIWIHWLEVKSDLTMAKQEFDKKPTKVNGDRQKSHFVFERVWPQKMSLQ